jgi:hypothetical protein
MVEATVRPTPSSIRMMPIVLAGDGIRREHVVVEVVAAEQQRGDADAAVEQRAACRARAQPRHRHHAPGLSRPNTSMCRSTPRP